MTEAPTPETAAARDHFIPLRKPDIVSALKAIGPLPGATSDQNFTQFCEMVSHIFHFEYYHTLEHMRDSYFYFNPELSADDRPKSLDQDAAYAELVENFEHVMQAANFEAVEQEEALAKDPNGRLSKVTLKINFDAYRDVRLYRRGVRRETLEEKQWFGFKTRRYDAEIYENVVLFVAVQPDPDKVKNQTRLPPGSVIIKFFRDIVKADIRTLYPNARVVMGWKDTLLLGGPAIAGLAPLSVKLLPVIGLVFLALGGLFGIQSAIETDASEARLQQAVAALSGIVAIGAFMGRQYGNYQRRSLKYQKLVADTVYYSNINNNTAAFDYLVGAAEQQEVKEAILAYHFLARATEPASQEALDADIEAWIQATFDVTVDFEVDDALAKLERLGVATRDAAGRWSVRPLRDALTALDGIWDNYFQYAQDAERASVPA